MSEYQTGVEYAETARERTPQGIETAIAEMNDMVMRAQKTTEMLKGRLSKVCRPSEPTPMNPDAELKSIRNERSDVAERLEGMAAQLRSALNVVDDVIRRLDV